MRQSLPRHQVQISIDGCELAGDLVLPDAPKGLIVFAHGGGSSRNSPRNAFVAVRLHHMGFATLLFDMVTADEDAVVAQRRDLDLRTRRLDQALSWVSTQEVIQDLPVGVFGSSTGAAAAFRVAACSGNAIKAIVSRGGRTDLAECVLDSVDVPTLLIAGEYDIPIIGMNEAAMHALPSTTAKRLRIIPRATHLFEEPGALESVARMSGEWFERFCNLE